MDEQWIEWYQVFYVLQARVDAARAELAALESEVARWLDQQPLREYDDGR